MPLQAPWKIVSPKGVLHFVPDKEALAHLSKSHGLRNEYLRNTIGFGGAAKSEHNGWQPLASSLPAGWDRGSGAKWLLHEPSGLMLVVPGGATTFLANFDAYRTRLNAADEDPPHLRSLQSVLVGVRPHPSSPICVRADGARSLHCTDDRAYHMEVDRRAGARGSSLPRGAVFVRLLSAACVRSDRSGA